MGSFSDFSAGATLDWVFTKTPAAPPTSFWVALSTTPWNSDGTGGTEPTGGAYARVEVTAANFARTANEMLSQVQVQFPQATASWGTITHFALFSASTAGNIWYTDALQASKVVNSGDRVVFDANELKVTGVLVA